MITIYEYAGCSTCRRALKFLEARGVAFQRVAIVDQPPGIPELRRMLGYLAARGRGLRHLFNTSGERYRALKIGERLKAGLSEAEALKLLAADGKLIKRPFLLVTKDGTVGFDEDLWRELIDSRR